ncbi:PAS domain S-box protein [Frigoriglobus tundricola]|uniref:histidine kinase n=1 Tax=Frigoriglobus tundricola TaxID=2774151 RepID=A0A6M5Z1P1_9BACT|nr:PAS domain S-box protein [Frigoriglobus tundricola]QJW99413.1 hypothetical protein FTUN_7025 [Frigoriglobus tundricola]
MMCDFAPAEFCSLLDSAPDPIVVVDDSGRVAFVNAPAEALFGYPRNEVCGRPAALLVPDWTRAEHADDGSGPTGFRKDGTGFPLRIGRSRARLDDRFVVLTIDAPRPDAAPPAGGDPFGEAFDATDVPTALTDAGDRFVRVNAAFTRTFGYPQAEVLGMPTTEITHPDDRHVRDRDAVPRADGAGPSVQAEKRYIHRDGHVFSGHVTVFPVRAAGGQPQAYLSQFRDRATLNLAEDEARHRAARFRAFFEATTAGMVEVAPDGRFLAANGAFCRMIGYTFPELSAMTAADVLFPEDRDRVLAQLGDVIAGRVTAYEADRRYRRKNGTALWVRVSVVAQDAAERPSGVSAVLVDVTEQKRLEEQFRHAQRVEAVGLRASGIAHDFNNLLTVINGCAEILLDGFPNAGPTRDLVQELTTACRRATGLTAQLLAFSRNTTFEPRVLNLNEVISQSVRILHRLLGPDIELVTDLAADLNGVRADPTQMEQVLLNLAINAKDAMPRGGRLRIETRDVRLTEADGAACPDLPPGDYVRLTVSDTGTGMTDEVKARAFEPFFTTKEVGKGTGLGLAVVHGAVTQSGGRVNVSSEPGTGTTFDIVLPAAGARVPNADTDRVVV